ncbi:MAG: hypothetical protein M0011_15450 [Elusimicrobia bacterium]|nr:hypothetical protein [Elusimicrobiota bacterium]
MYKYLSSFSALMATVLVCALTASAQDLTVRDTPQDSAGFTAYQKEWAKKYPDYFIISTGSVRVTLQEVKEEPDMSYVRLQEEPPKDLNSVLVSVEKIVNIASKLWEIVKDGKPVANIDTKYATAYPDGVTSATQLAQWTKPKTYVYGFYAANLYGSTMIDCKYKVSYTYSGSYKGVGKFLTGVAVIPTSITVGWGYRFDMSAQVPDSTIANVGTDKSPVAAMQLKLTWKMSTVLKEVTGTSVYYVQGDGYYEEIASPWKKDQKEPENVKAAAPLITFFNQQKGTVGDVFARNSGLGNETCAISDSRPIVPIPTPIPVPLPPVPHPAVPPAEKPCSPCPEPPPSEIHTDHQHGNCKNGHEHYFEYHQEPAPGCKCRLVKKTKCL